MAGGSQEGAATAPCRICGSPEMSLAKPSDIHGQINSAHVKITDDTYGVTAAIYRCPRCGFMQCSEVEGVESAYVELEDPAYEAGREERGLQARAILTTLMSVAGADAGKKRLLDVGAGSGILVEAATGLGFDAEGIEPSRWLQSAARRHGCNVHLGTLPHPELSGDFDFVTMVDVIEHVDDPVGLVRSAAVHLRPGGLLLVVTPDAASFAARMMGWRWWHYRAAHVGYFSRSNLERCLAKAGLAPKAFRRPGWVFSVEYLRARLLRYLPAWLLPKHRAWMGRRSVPLNLLDSMLIIAARDQTERA